MYAKSAVTIANILDAAEQLFTQRHYADVTMTGIADAADVTKGALYHHFSGKEDLYLSMMHNYLEEIQEIMGAVVRSSGTSREKLRRFAYTFLTLPDQKQNLMRLVRRDINLFSGAEREALVRAYQAALPEQAEAIISEGIARGEIKEADARLLSWEHVASVEVVLRPYALEVVGDAAAMADFVVELFFDGVARRGGEGSDGSQGT